MLKILIIDDQLFLLDVLRMALEGNYYVKTARNGLEAIELMDRWKVDLIITDHSMPGMTGLEVIKAVRAMKSPPKVIFYTACLNKNLEGEARKAGAIEVMDKPFDLHELKEKIKIALGQEAC
ncbi:response regulator [bacterium]|nr:response regulator [bacterium]